MHDRHSWVAELLNELAQSGPTGRENEQYLRARKIRIGVRNQSSGARWTLGRRIDLVRAIYTAHRSLPTPSASWCMRSSISGRGTDCLIRLRRTGSLAGPVQFPAGDHRWVQGRSRPGDANSGALAAAAGMGSPGPPGARGLMRQYAGRRYRIDLLPLYPLHHEFMYCLVRRRPRSAAAP